MINILITSVTKWKNPELLESLENPGWWHSSSTIDAERQRIMKHYREGEGESREFSRMDKAKLVLLKR